MCIISMCLLYMIYAFLSIHFFPILTFGYGIACIAKCLMMSENCLFHQVFTGSAILGDKKITEVGWNIFGNFFIYLFSVAALCWRNNGQCWASVCHISICVCESKLRASRCSFLCLSIFLHFCYCPLSADFILDVRTFNYLLRLVSFVILRERKKGRGGCYAN